MRRCLGCNTLIPTGSRCKACQSAYRVPTDWAEAVKARDGYRCGICGTMTDVEAHHIIPRSQGGEHTLANGDTLCRSCHRAIHRHDRAGVA